MTEADPAQKMKVNQSTISRNQIDKKFRSRIGSTHKIGEREGILEESIN